VAQVGLTQAFGALWDSRRQLSLFGAAGTGVFPRVYLNLWDSRPPTGDPTHAACENKLKFLKSICRSPFSSPQKAGESGSHFALYGMSVHKFSFSCSSSGDTVESRPPIIYEYRITTWLLPANATSRNRSRAVENTPGCRKFRVQVHEKCRR
jgi:hypothetical protein